jgi:uncharacterized protein with von Willebrand factor type A (vWA) domain
MRIVNLIQKKPVTANCDQGSGVCTVTIQNFPIPIAAPCQAGDCVSPTNAVLQAGARPRRAARQAAPGGARAPTGFCLLAAPARARAAGGVRVRCGQRLFW